MDKQQLKKHHFWILLALAVLLIPVVLGGTIFGVGSAASTEKASIDKKLNDLRSQQPKSVQYLAKLDEQKGVLEVQRNKVWEEVYKAQAGMIQWPDALKQLDDLYFGDKLPQEIKSGFRNDLYRPLYTTLPAIIEPTQFVDRDWTKVLQSVNWSKDPTDEECWLAIETLCVQREILKDIQAVNLMLASFLPVPNPAEKPPEDPEEKKAFDARIAQEKAEAEAAKKKLNVKDDEGFGRFVSPYWLLDLAVSRAATGKAGELIFRGEITNRSGHRQNLARIDFKVWFSDPKADPGAVPVILPIQHEYLSEGESFAFNDVRVTGSARQMKPLALEQKLDLRFAPVKRVDQLRLGYPSHRHADRTLVAAGGEAFEEAKKEAEAAAASAASSGGAMGSGPPGARGGGGDGPTGSLTNSTDFTANGLPRLRYLGRSDQVRWMPIAVTLIVDQSHIQDIARAFANSRLRFQGTQLHWQRFRGQLGLGVDNATGSGTGEFATAPGGSPDSGPPRPSGSSSGGAMAGGRPPRAGGPAAPGGFRPGVGSDDAGPPGAGRPSFAGAGTGGGRFTGAGGTGFGGSPSASGTGTNPEDEGPANLVEVSIYGIASLYEKFPPKAPSNPAGGNPAPTADATAGQTPPMPMGAAAPAATTTPTSPAQPMPPKAESPPAAGGTPVGSPMDPAATPTRPMGTNGGPGEAPGTSTPPVTPPAAPAQPATSPPPAPNGGGTTAPPPASPPPKGQ